MADTAKKIKKVAAQMESASQDQREELQKIMQFYKGATEGERRRLLGFISRKAGEDDDYKLTQEEYGQLCDAFYDAQSLIRMNTKNKTEIKDMDAWNVCNVVMEKFRIIEPLLVK